MLSQHRTKWIVAFFIFATIVPFLIVQASDHDDGEMDLKGRALNITDVYAFREDWQNGNAQYKDNLILIMNTNPRSLPTQQYFFSTTALYQFHLSQIAANEKTVRPTGQEDVVLRLQFGTPNEKNQQAATFSLVKDGKTVVVSATTDGKPIYTTDITASKNNQPINNLIQVNGQPVTVFAGLREDPFFFDVEQFFKMRAAAVATKRFIGFLPPNQAKDFTHNYNVNSIVLRVPIALLQSAAAEPVFDVWTTIWTQK